MGESSKAHALKIMDFLKIYSTLCIRWIRKFDDAGLGQINKVEMKRVINIALDDDYSLLKILFQMKQN